MNPLGLILGGVGALLVGVLASNSSNYVKAGSCGWCDEVGSSHLNALNKQVDEFNSLAKTCRDAIAAIGNIRSVEFTSQESIIDANISNYDAVAGGNY